MASTIVVILLILILSISLIQAWSNVSFEDDKNNLIYQAISYSVIMIILTLILVWLI